MNTLQTDISDPQVKKRQELLDRLHKKLIKKQEERYKPSQQKLNKIEKEVKKEKKRNDEDPRVTQLMKDYFIHAIKQYPKVEIPDPHTILENKDEFTLKYYKLAMKLLKENNNDAEVLNNPYCNYMRNVLGIEQ